MIGNKRKTLEHLIIKSYIKCLEKGIPTSLDFPLFCLPREDLEKRIKKNETLINIFKTYTKRIVRNIPHYIFLLTDFEGYLLEFVYCKRKYKNLSNLGITYGISLKEESCGINAVSLALTTMKTARITQENHYCNLFKDWDCIATPLKIDNTIIGCLDISAIGMVLPKEAEEILELLAYKMVNEYIKRSLKDSKENIEEKLNSKQIKILQLSAEGHKELAIALEIGISISTVKYHKKEIIKKMKVKNFKQAITKAIRMNLI
ncbi:MAG: LuxR C-terminal-related transcriptional regulator [Candidatus Pacearchaeota archaeon]